MLASCANQDYSYTYTPVKSHDNIVASYQCMTRFEMSPYMTRFEKKHAQL